MGLEWDQAGGRKVLSWAMVSLEMGASSPPAVIRASVASTPGPPAATNGWIWAMAVEHTGACITDAKFEIVSGQGPDGDIIRQETPCSVWDDGGGIMLRNLTTGALMTLRASAPGYNTVERSLFPKLAGTVEAFVLDRQ